MMIDKRALIQLLCFGIAAVVAVAYGGVRFFDARALIDPPYRVDALFEHGGGIYRQADVELLGTRVGEVADIRPGPRGSTRVRLAIDADVRIPRGVTAAIAVKSAIGEQVVELTPVSGDSPPLAAGSTIPLASTRTPLRVEKLLESADALLASVPSEDLRTVIQELAVATGGTGPDLRRLIHDSDQVTTTLLRHLDSMTSLIRTSNRVLRTQQDLAGETRVSAREAAELLSRVENLSGDLAASFRDGADAAAEVTMLLTDLQSVLPILLGDLATLVGIAGGRLDALLKTIVLFPWALETGGQAARSCDKYNPTTGKPVESTCHFDDRGRPLYRAYFAVQLPELPGNPPYLPCTKGYEETRKFLPDGTALDGGPRYNDADEPNMNAVCRAAPTDPIQPNVRGTQNVR